MVGRIWRRLRSLFDSWPRAEETAPRGVASSQPPAAPAEAGYLSAARDSGEGEASTSPYVGARPAAAVEPRPVAELAERLSLRLVEDEGLRGSLTDDEYQPLLDWATRRVDELARSAGALPPAAAEAYFNQVAAQLLELLRVVDLAVGERQSFDPGVTASRFQLLDTLLAPPLLPGPVATAAQVQLEALLADPADCLISADGPELVSRIVAMLG